MLKEGVEIESEWKEIAYFKDMNAKRQKGKEKSLKKRVLTKTV